MAARAKRKYTQKIYTFDKAQGNLRSRSDVLATEEPLELRLISSQGQKKTVAITMRTPGHDFELAAGFLYSEGILQTPEEITRIAYCIDADTEQRYNIVNVYLRAAELPELSSLERHFTTTSACGVCGKANLEQLSQQGCEALPSTLMVDPELVLALPAQLRRVQELFDKTGGLHAAALFSSVGELLAFREDVGRHNATDKLIGWAFLQGHLPLTSEILLLSGRASFELLQKALSARIQVVCAVSAPSSLAVQVARRFNITLIGFLREERFNIYEGVERMQPTLAVG